MADKKRKSSRMGSNEVFLPWLIARKERIFFIFLALFMMLLLIYQGGAGDLAKAPIWAFKLGAFLAFLLFYLLEYSRPEDKNLPLPSNRQPIFKLIGSYLLIFLLVNVLTSISWKSALSESLTFLMILSIMCLVSIYASTRKRIWYVVYILLSIGLVAAISGLIGYFTRGASTPLDSFFAWHNPAGGYFASILMVFLALMFTKSPSTIDCRLGWIGKILVGAALVFTLSRGAWLAAVFAVILLLMLIGAKQAFNRKSISIAVVFVIAVIAILAIVGGKSVLTPVYHRIVSFTATQDFSMTGRENFYSAARDIFNDHKITGSGLGTYGYLYPQYQKDPRFFARDPHSFYLRLLAEGGIFGILMIAGILWGYVYLLVLFFRNRENPDSSLAAGLIAALTAGLLHMVIDFDDTFPFILLNLGVIWILALNILEPINEPEMIADEEEKPKVTGAIAGATLLLAIVVFAGVYYCARVYHSESYYDIGRKFTTAQMWSNAVESYQASYRIFPGNDHAAVELNRSLLFMLDSESARMDSDIQADLYNRAMDISQKLKKSAPYDSRSFFLSGLTLNRSDSNDDRLQAIRDFGRAVELDPMNSPRYYLDFARALTNAGDQSSSVLLIGRFKEIYPFVKLEEYAKTRLDWIDLPDTYQDVITLEGEILMQNGYSDEAKEAFSEVIQIEEIRKTINGENYKPRDILLNYIDRLLNEIKSGNDAD